MKILAICPTIYPDKFNRMYDSYAVTASKYTTLLSVTQKGGITKLINEAFSKHNDYDYYIIINDDLVFETPLWDTALAQAGKITHGDDKVPSGLAGQFLMIPGDFARAVGWLQMPALNRYAGDVCWRFIGQQLDCLQYHSEVIITHNWDGCAEPLVNEMDMASFAAWLPKSHKDIERIRKCLNITE